MSESDLFGPETDLFSLDISVENFASKNLKG